jgi:hypothetical protein
VVLTTENLRRLSSSMKFSILSGDQLWVTQGPRWRIPKGPAPGPMEKDASGDYPVAANFRIP